MVLIRVRNTSISITSVTPRSIFCLLHENDKRQLLKMASTITNGIDKREDEGGEKKALVAPFRTYKNKKELKI